MLIDLRPKSLPVFPSNRGPSGVLESKGVIDKVIKLFQFIVLGAGAVVKNSAALMANPFSRKIEKLTLKQQLAQVTSSAVLKLKKAKDITWDFALENQSTISKIVAVSVILIGAYSYKSDTQVYSPINPIKIDSKPFNTKEDRIRFPIQENVGRAVGEIHFGDEMSLSAMCFNSSNLQNRTTPKNESYQTLERVLENGGEELPEDSSWDWLEVGAKALGSFSLIGSIAVGGARLIDNFSSREKKESDPIELKVSSKESSSFIPLVPKEVDEIAE